MYEVHEAARRMESQPGEAAALITSGADVVYCKCAERRKADSPTDQRGHKVQVVAQVQGGNTIVAGCDAFPTIAHLRSLLTQTKKKLDRLMSMLLSCGVLVALEIWIPLRCWHCSREEGTIRATVQTNLDEKRSLTWV